MSVGKTESCVKCGKLAYPMEAISADDKTFHKTCFRCSQCQGLLKLGNYAALDGKLFCKPHFKQLFGSHGNYSTGFGQLKPQEQFELGKGRLILQFLP